MDQPNFRQVIIEESARELYIMYTALVNAGFSAAEAINLTSAYFSAVLKP